MEAMSETGPIVEGYHKRGLDRSDYIIATVRALGVYQLFPVAKIAQNRDANLKLPEAYIGLMQSNGEVGYVQQKDLVGCSQSTKFTTPDGDFEMSVRKVVSPNQVGIESVLELYRQSLEQVEVQEIDEIRWDGTIDLGLLDAHILRVADQMEVSISEGGEIYIVCWMFSQRTGDFRAIPVKIGRAYYTVQTNSISITREDSVYDVLMVPDFDWVSRRYINSIEDSMQRYFWGTKLFDSELDKVDLTEVGKDEPTSSFLSLRGMVARLLRGSRNHIYPPRFNDDFMRLLKTSSDVGRGMIHPSISIEENLLNLWLERNLYINIGHQILVARRVPESDTEGVTNDTRILEHRLQHLVDLLAIGL